MAGLINGPISRTMSALGPSLTNFSVWPMSGIGPKAEVDDQADALATLRVDPLGGEHQLACPRRADGARQQPGDAVVAAHAHTRIAGADERRLGRDPDIASQSNREPGAGRGARQRGDGGLA